MIKLLYNIILIFIYCSRFRLAAATLAGGIINTAPDIITRFKGFLGPFSLYPYNISFLHKNAFKRQIMRLYGHIRPANISRNNRKTARPDAIHAARRDPGQKYHFSIYQFYAVYIIFSGIKNL